MSQRYTEEQLEEQQAAVLARWLDRPDAPLPPELDPEVAGAVYALSPGRAPRAPELDLDALLDGIAEGPFSVRPARAEPVRAEPVRAEPAERRPDQRRVQASASSSLSSSPRPPEPRRLLPRRMIPAAGLLAAAALAAVLVIPMATRLGVTEPNPDVLNAPMPQMASAMPSPAERAEAEPARAGDKAAEVVGGAIPEAAPAIPGGVEGRSAPKAAAPPATPTATMIPAPAPVMPLEASPGYAGGAAGPGGGNTGVNTGAANTGAANTGAASAAGMAKAVAERAGPAADAAVSADYDEAEGEAEDDVGAPAGAAYEAQVARSPQREDVAIAEAERGREQKPKTARAERDAPQAMAPAPPPAMAVPAMAGPSQSAGGGAAVWPLDYAEGWYTRYPDVVAAYEAALALERARSWSAAGEAWRRLMADERNSVAQDAAFRAARAWWQAGQAATALRLIEEGLRRSTANTAFRARLYALKADVLIAEGRAQEAEAARQQAILLNGAR